MILLNFESNSTLQNFTRLHFSFYKGLEHRLWSNLMLYPSSLR